MYVEKSVGLGSKFFRVLFRFMFERKIKMNVSTFVIFALTANYCFIDGCRSKETTVVSKPFCFFLLFFFRKIIFKN